MPLGHVAHYAIWVLYAVPVLIVTAAIVRAAIAQRRAERDEEESA